MDSDSIMALEWAYYSSIGINYREVKGYYPDDTPRFGPGPDDDYIGMYCAGGPL